MRAIALVKETKERWGGVGGGWLVCLSERETDRKRERTGTRNAVGKFQREKRSHMAAHLDLER